jgi:hypothetical protein
MGFRIPSGLRIPYVRTRERRRAVHVELTREPRVQAANGKSIPSERQLALVYDSLQQPTDCDRLFEAIAAPRRRSAVMRAISSRHDGRASVADDDSAGVSQTRTREVSHLPPRRNLDRRVLRLIGKSRIAAQKRKQRRMAPHDGVDVDKFARKAGLRAHCLDDPRSRGAVYFVDENHVHTLRRDALILDLHTASSWIELHLKPATANGDEVRLRPRPSVWQAC